MPSGTLLLAGVVGAIAGSVFLVVGDLVRRREVDAESRPASRAFALFWYAIGVHALLVGIADVAAALETPLEALYPAFRLGLLVLLAAGLGGLTYYLTYLFTGRRGWWKGFAALYGLAAALGAAQIVRRGESATAVGRWGVDLYAQTGAHPVAYALTALLFLLPPLVGAFLYGRLARALDDPEQRLRVRLVSTAIFVWFLGAILSRLSDHDLWLFLVRPVLGVGVAGIVLVAHRPPAWVQRRLASRRAPRDPSA